MPELILSRPGISDPGERHWSNTLNIGIAYLASSARARGLSVGVVDGKLEGHKTVDETVEAILAQRPAFVGLSAMTVEYPGALEIASRLKESEDRPIVMLGGAHANALPAESLDESPAFDYVLAGEAERALPDLIEVLKNGEDPNEIPGLFKRDERGEPLLGGPRERDLDVASIPFPAWDLFPRVSAYPVITVRGCPYQCVFCCKNLGHRMRPRSIDHVMEEIEWLHLDFSPSHIHFADETFGLQPEYTEELLFRLNQFNKTAGIRFIAATRADHVSERMIQAMKNTGFEFVSIGVESGDPDVLSRSCKGIRIDQVEKAVRIVKNSGIKLRLYFIIGLPGETKETVRRTINLAVKLNPDWISAALIVPYPGSQIYKWAIEGKNGYRFLSKKWGEFDKYLGASLELDNLSYRSMQRLQVQLYLETYIRNARFGDLTRFLFQHRLLFWSYGRKLLAFLLLRLKSVL